MNLCRSFGMLIALTPLSGAYAAPSVTVEGACGETLTITVTDADRYRLLWGEEAADVLGGGPCAGTEVGVEASLSRVTQVLTEATQEVALPTSVCGQRIQALDMDTCETSQAMGCWPSNTAATTVMTGTTRAWGVRRWTKTATAS
jgi:hypothetical protein